MHGKNSGKRLEALSKDLKPGALRIGVSPLGKAGRSNETAEALAESLLNPAIRPYNDGNQLAKAARFVQCCLTEFHAALVIDETLVVPFPQ